MLNKKIEVTYKVYSSEFTIKKALLELNTFKVLSFDLETQSLYSIANKIEAKELLKKDTLDPAFTKLCKQAAHSSGLSNPRLIKATHFIFGTSKESAIILIANSYKIEVKIFEWLAKFTGKVLIWNSLFDLKIMYERVNALPIDYEDPMLLLKSLINDTQAWNCKVGLKDVMAEYYDNKWCLIETYDVKDLKDKNFLRYCSIDAAATFYGWELLQERKE
jgi:hypothetical protein